MNRQRARTKLREWTRRYLPAEILATAGALAAATITFSQTHSYAAATGAGWVGEGICFYGYFALKELLTGASHYRGQPLVKRIYLGIASASANLLVEFAPAEILDTFIIRPFLTFLVPHFIHPYWLGFLVGKFSADAIFYLFAITGYETKNRWLRR